jgi:hypothetical protein
MPPDPWHRRFLGTPPPLPDWVWTLWQMGMYIGLGVLIGYAWCMSQYRPQLTPVLQTPPAWQQQLDRLEQRVRALEQR